MKALLAQFAGNVLAAGLQELDIGSARAVQLDATGVPVAWRLFSFGPFTITKDGETLAGEFLPEHAERILAHARQKGQKVPIDAEHGLKALADRLGVEEADLVPLLNRRAVTLGFGALALRAEPPGAAGLWIEDVEWHDLGRRVIAEKVLRWFSPVIRGLQDGRLRITSVALTNTPAIDGLDAIAASAEDDTEIAGAPGVRTADGEATRAATPAEKGAPMKGLLTKLGVLCGLAEADAAALTADKAESALLPKLEPLLAEVPALRAAKAAHEALLGDLRKGLALGAETPPEAVKGRFLALVEKAGKDASELSAISARVQALETEKTTRERQALIDQGLAEGKLTPALVESWAKQQDVATLSAFLAVQPVIVQPGRQLDNRTLRPADSVALSALETEVARKCGLEPKDVQDAWKKHTQSTAAA